MNDVSTLTSVAELAISLIGMSGIVAVFLTKKPIGALDSARFLTIVSTGSLVALLAFVPIWLARFLAEGPIIWRIAAGTALGLSLVSNLVVGALARTSLKDVSATFAGDHWGMRLAAALMTVAVVALMAMNIFAWPIQANRSIYELMLFIGLIQMAIAFASLVFSDRN